MPTTPATQDVVVGLTLDGNFRIHAAGCRDIGRESYQNRWNIKGAESCAEVAADAYSDFIPEEMTVEDALGNCSFAPCVTLPTYVVEVPTEVFNPAWSPDETGNPDYTEAAEAKKSWNFLWGYDGVRYFSSKAGKHYFVRSN